MRSLFATAYIVLICLWLVAVFHPYSAIASLATQPELRTSEPPTPTSSLLGNSKSYTPVTHARFDFEDGLGGPDAQGWTSVDLTLEPTRFHVDDLAGLGGGNTGGLIALAGSQSLWCGARPGDPETEHFSTLPGYGRSWDQLFESTDFVRSAGDVDVSFLTRYDLNLYHYVYLEYLSISGSWNQLAMFFGQHMATNLSHSSTIPADSLGVSVRVRFRLDSNDGTSADENGNDTDGAILIDNLRVRDAGTLNEYEDFEDEAVGATDTNDGNWTAAPLPPFGNYAGLLDGTSVVQEDPLGPNNSHFWGFIDGSTDSYDCAGFPGQAAVPYGTALSQIANEVRSPWIDLGEDENGGSVPMTGFLELEFDVYRDLELSAGIYYEWKVRSMVGGVPGPWLDHNFVYYGNDKDWHRFEADITGLVDPNATALQIAIGVVDQALLRGYPGNCHSHAPLIDNVQVNRVPNVEVVTNINNSGAGSFRQALSNVAANPTASAITFNIPGTGPHVIKPSFILPSVGAHVLIDGYTQPGSRPNRNPIDEPNDAQIMVVIDGSLIPPVPGISGLILDGGHSIVRGLAIGNYGRNGIQIQSGSNEVVGCFVGIAPDGYSDIGNRNGILVGGSRPHTIGGPDPQDHNIITHNTIGIRLFNLARSVTVQGNFIGVSVDGVYAPGNSSSGIHMSDAASILIGGENSDERNVISGNATGIYITNCSSIDIDGNRIGTFADGTGLAGLGNANDGIFVSSTSTDINLGSIGVGNLIAYNGRDGIRVDPSHVGDLTILGNSIDLNGALGLDIGADGVSSNNAPVLTGISSVSQNADVFGTLTYDTPDQWVTIDFYESPVCDESGFGEAARYVDSFDLYVGPTGTEVFVAPVATPTAGTYLSALTRSHSEFSNCLEFVNTPLGQDVDVAVGDDGSGDPQVSLTFDFVTTPGATTIEEAESCADPPVGFMFGGATCWELETTAAFANSITVCFSYNESEITGPELALVLMHYDSVTSSWVDITTSLDPVANTICGQTSSLSPFRMAAPELPTGVSDNPALPSRLALQQNYPNPFNPVTTISFELPAGSADVTLAVYDIRGRLIRTLLREKRGAGPGLVQWDGTDATGRAVASGMYFYRLQAGDFSETRRMVLLK